MPEDTTEPSSDRAPSDSTHTMRQFAFALEGFARWPWSSFRQQALIVALNTVLEVHVSRIVHLATQTIAGPVETVKAQLGRHERRMVEMDRRIKALEDGREKQVGGGDGAL